MVHVGDRDNKDGDLAKDEEDEKAKNQDEDKAKNGDGEDAKPESPPGMED